MAENTPKSHLKPKKPKAVKLVQEDLLGPETFQFNGCKWWPTKGKMLRAVKGSYTTTDVEEIEFLIEK